MDTGVQQAIDDQLRAVWHEAFLLAEMFYRYRDKGTEFHIAPELAFYIGCLNGALSAHLPKQERNRVMKAFRKPQDWEPGEGEQQMILAAKSGKVFIHEHQDGRFTLGLCPSSDPEKWHGLMIELTEHQRSDLIEFLGDVDVEAKN